jgi:hypothetical protein
VRLIAHGRSTDIPIDRIVRIERPDSLKNGALIGLGLGLGSGAIGAFIERRNRGRLGHAMVLNAIGNGVIWTALGTAMDAMVDNRRTLFRRGGGTQTRVSPVIDRGVRAVELSVIW